MSMDLKLIPNLRATSSASLTLLGVRVSASGRQYPRVLFPPIAFEQSTAVTLESRPPDIPTTRFLTPVLSEWVLRNLTILSIVSSGSPAENGSAPVLGRMVVPLVRGRIKPEWSS